MIIRAARADDSEAIAALTRALTEKFVSHEFAEEGRAFLHAALSPDEVRRDLAAGLRYHVCEDHGRIVGVVATRDDRHLLKLFVAEEVQGLGLARALWEVARSACQAAGYAGPFTVSASRHAVPAYQALGFVRSGPETVEHGVARIPMHTP